jgi:hypothetical protein
MIPIKDAVLAARSFFSPAVRAYLKRKKLEIDTLDKHNLTLSQTSDRRKGPALAVAERY